VLIVAAATLGRSNIAAAQDECFGSTPDILGTPGDDIITATNGGENISGLGGNDLIQSSGGANNICGGDGADTIIFSGGADNVAGGDGNDTLTGTSDYNGVYGGPGDDTIDVTGVGNYYGDAGDDTIDATSNNSNIYGGPDNDAIDVTGNGDAIHGEFDNDSVNVEGDADSIDGGPGDDDLHAIGDYDSIDGNDGYDTCTVSGAGNSMTACESFYGDLAAHWAPVIYQDTDSTCAVADYVTNFDYDGDWQGIDNWEHLATDTTNSFFGTTSCQALRSTPSYVYYWVVETANDWYIGYALFHPRDWSDGTCLQAAGNANCHENDMEGVLLTVQKDGSP
jgi:Ca2+-binding RTX toxin-like protein